MFGIKDVFTTINLVGGSLAIILCIEGYPFEAGVAVVLGYLCGDAIDGWIARRLGTANAFGAEYDIVSDHLTHVIAPAAILYSVYARSGLLPGTRANQVLGAVLATIVIGASTIRHARNAVKKVKVAGIWSGLPRTVLGFMVMGFVLSALVTEHPQLLWIGVVMVPLASWATLTRIPFPSHRLPRGHYPFIKLVVALAFAAMIGTLLAYPRFLFDVLFISMIGAMLGSVAALSPEERREYHAEVARQLAREESA